MKPATAFYWGMSLILGVTFNLTNTPWWVVLLAIVYGFSNYLFGLDAPSRYSKDCKMNDARTCKHSTLRFGSGAYYVFCDGCTRKWVAITGPKDTDIDYGAGGDQVCGEARTAPIDSPAD